MDSGYYAACTALLARTQALDAVANNLANTGTTGFRAEHSMFRSVLASAGQTGSPLNQAINNFGVLGDSRFDLAQGNLERTGNDTDLAIEGSGFFVVQTPKGVVYTRNGNFQVSPQGQLITSQGDPVMGDKGIVNVLGGKLNISADGTLSVNGAVAGKLKIVEFPAGTQLESLGETYYTAPKGTSTEAKNSSVRQGMLESSNVNPVSSVVQLIMVQRAAEMMQRALTMFHNDINKVATQDLPRV